MGKEILTEKKAKSTPQGGVLVGKRKGQTIIHDAGTQGGYFVGKLHSEGGIKGINKTTGQPIEVQGGEVIITAPAVADQTKRNFNGEMLTNREVLSKINENGGGVSFADGGDIPSEVYFNGTSYEFGGESLSDYEIMRKMNDCSCEDEYEIGGYNAKTIWDFKNTKEGMDYVDEEIVDKAVGIYVGGKASKVDANELKLKKGGGVDLIEEDVKTKVPRDFSPNTYDDIVDVHTDGITGGETGFELGDAVGGADASFEDGGNLDFLDDAVKQFDDGGSTGNQVDAIRLDTASSRYLGSMLKTEYDSFQEFLSDLQDAFITQDKFGGYFYFYVLKNGEKITPSRLAIQFKNNKNTVLNFNPLTGKSSDFYKQIERRYGSTIRRNNLDFTNWLGGKSTPKPQPQPEPKKEEVKEEVKEATKIDFEATKKYLFSRINNLTKELNFKKPRLSNEEIGFYQRDINNLIEKLRTINEKELDFIPYAHRSESAYSLKWGDINAEYKPAKLLAPNGLPTKLTDDEYLKVSTDNFKSFFGDWILANETNDFSGVSKVIDPETKEPMPVYHGTNVLFTEWKTYKTNNAHYFAKNRDFSEWFAEQWSKGRGDISAKDSKLLKALNPDKGTYLYRCFLDIKNPIDFSRFGVEKRPVSDFILFLKINYNIGDFDFWTNFTLFNNLTQDTLVYSWMIIRNWQSFTEYIKMATTYDGYIFYEYHPEKVGTGLDGASLSFCAFDSSQIKFTNATEFNALITDSRFEQGGKL